MQTKAVFVNDALKTRLKAQEPQCLLTIGLFALFKHNSCVFTVLFWF